MQDNVGAVLFSTVGAQGEHQTLFALIEHYISKFNELSKSKNLYFILRGINSEDDDSLHLNTFFHLGRGYS